MTTLKFADTHNLVAFLEKSTKSDGFEQIVDFLNAHTIKYALTVNPTIYISCIEQFWTTTKVKTVNEEVQLQALVDGKKIIITDSIVRRDLQLEDAEGVDYLPNATIFEQLTLMGYEKLSQKLTFFKAFFSPQWKFLIHTVLQCLSPKTTAWNEFSSNIASAIICLATSQKFNFSKLIFESMVKNLDNVGKFLMYPRFIQVFLDKQLEGMSNHKRIYIAPSHTKKIFGNIRRVGKGFSGRVTPLFPTMMVQAQQEQGEGSAMPTDPQHTPTITQPSTSQPKKTQTSRKPKKNTEVPQPSGSTDNAADEAVYKELDDSLVRAATTASSLEAEQDSGNIIKTRSKATPNEAGSQGTTLGGGPRRQDTMGDTITQTRFKNVSKTSNDLLLAGVNTPRKHKDCSSLRDYKFETESQEVREERRVKNSQAQKIIQGVLDDEEVFAGHDMAEKEINVAEKEVSTVDLVTTVSEVVTTTSVEISTASLTETINADDLTLAQTLIEIRSAKPKVKGVVIGEQSESTTRIRPQQLPSKDKGKAIMEEPEKLTKRKDQIRHDEEVAQRLQAQLKAELEEEDRLIR
ncbi:hypothetical protein Tco_0966587 [Tanacetum coccineum]